MTALTCFLVVVASSDLARLSADRQSHTRAVVVTALGWAALWGLFAWVHPPAHGVWAWIVAALAYVVWAAASSESFARDRDGSARLAGALAWGAIAALTAGVLCLVLAGDAAGEWPDLDRASWIDPPAADYAQVALVVALGLIQVSTANVIVRLVLKTAGVPANVNEKKVKGGRWIGALERVFIFSFGVAGQFGVASVVAGAKALLRLPEARSVDASIGPGDDGPSQADRSEYLVLGSFTSWLVAVACIGLALVHV